MKIGWIGTGVMGAPMAGHLLDAGHELAVFTRSREKAEGLLGRGAIWAEDPATAADGKDIVFSIVGHPGDVEATHLGQTGTLAATIRPGIIVDMTTSRPSLAEHIAQEAEKLGVASIDAPVSGGDVGAINGTLSIMVGGPAEAVATVQPLFELMGGQIVHQGVAGAGQHTKMVNQILIASTIMGVAEGLLYADRAGLDAERVIQSVGSGAAGSWQVNNLGPRMHHRDFKPGFYVEHFVKDLSLALDEAARLHIALPGLALARQLYEALRATGLDRKGSHAIMIALERLNGIDRPID